MNALSETTMTHTGQFMAGIKGGRALIYRPVTTANKISDDRNCHVLQKGRAREAFTFPIRPTMQRRWILWPTRKQKFVNVVNTQTAASKPRTRHII